MSINQKVKNGYNKAAQNYSSEFRDQFKNERHLQMLLEKLDEGSHILDAGCGAGKPIDSFLIDHGLKVTGIDISEEQISLAKKFVPSASYFVKDMSELKPGEYTVDAVVSFYAIFHTAREHHLDLLKTFNSFIKTDGYLLITMGANDWVGKEDDFCGAEMHWSHYGAEKNKELINDAGFEIIFDEIDTSGNEEHLIILAKKI
jgi:cyclopropane fatty-acyl-phospholipid synthase-like methyltransferase